MPWMFLLYLLSHKGDYQKVSPPPPVVIQPAPVQRSGPGLVDTRCQVVAAKGNMVTSVCP